MESYADKVAKKVEVKTVEKAKQKEMVKEHWRFGWTRSQCITVAQYSHDTTYSATRCPVNYFRQCICCKVSALVAVSEWQMLNVYRAKT